MLSLQCGLMWGSKGDKCYMNLWHVPQMRIMRPLRTKDRKSTPPICIGHRNGAAGVTNEPVIDPCRDPLLRTVSGARL